MKTKVYNIKGEENSEITLPEAVFSIPWNSDLVHQVVTSMRSNARGNTAHTKDRGEVRGGGKKPWQQKGLGRARHGSIRSPIWVGGGVAHGPRNEKNFSRKINKKMKDKALYAILTRKLKDNEIIFLDELSFKEPKAKDARLIMSSLGGIKGYESLSRKRANAAFIALPSKNILVEKSFNNFGNIEVGEVRNINPLTVLNYKYLIIANPNESLKFFNSNSKIQDKVKVKK